MNDLFSHIEFLLHTHDCVIVPNLGGFVLNHLPARKDGLSAFEAPAYELVFNRELTHNDGLLAESFMKLYQVSFEEANTRIERSVNELKSVLLSKGEAPVGSLGTFRTNEEGSFVFTPRKFVHPEYYGLSKVALQPIIQMQPATAIAEKRSGRKVVWRNIGIGTAAAAAVTAVVLLLSPFEKDMLPSQKANMMTESGLFKSHVPKSSEIKAANVMQAPTNTVTPVETTSSAGSEQAAQPEADLSATADAKKYFIVMGVYEVRNVAEQITEQLKAEGFSQTAWLERPGRIDVYVASFADKTEAEIYLKEMKTQHPGHSDAWVLKR